MGRKKPNTPRSRIVNAIRQLWLRSRERAKALKDADRKCTKCGVKESRAKGKEVILQVHHDPPIGKKWKDIVDDIAEHILEAPQYPLCKSCHRQIHEE